MSVNGPVSLRILAGCCLVALCTPTGGWAEQWREFHKERWNFRSEKLGKELQIRNVYYYDAANLRRSKSGTVTIWIKELAKNDRYYVGKGVPEQETIYKNVRISCNAKKYEILLDDSGDADYSESMSEEIKPGSSYDRLHSIVCRQQG